MSIAGGFICWMIIVSVAALGYVGFKKYSESKEFRKMLEDEKLAREQQIASYEASFEFAVDDFEKLREEELSSWAAKEWDHSDLLDEPIKQTDQARKIADAFHELYESSDRASLTGAKTVAIEKLNQIKQNVRDIENIFRVIEISDNSDVSKVMSKTLEKELSENRRILEKLTLLLAELTCFVNNNGENQAELFEVNKDMEINALTSALRKINHHPPKIGEEH